MSHKNASEALNRTMNDVLISGCRNTKNIMFGGKVVVFGGDFRQIVYPSYKMEVGMTLLMLLYVLPTFVQLSRF